MKRIVICADGTWNTRDQVDKTTGIRRATNVTKVARAVLPQTPGGTHQIVYYHDGVGTSGLTDRFTGGAFGRGMENNIRDLYRFIVYNYAPGDELYFFGFSRGAFTVRSLVGFMYKLGLIEKDDDYYVPEVYAAYERNKGPGSPEWEKASRKFEKPVRPCPPIRFVGVWDTVGALGAPGMLGQLFNKKKYRYHDVRLNSKIENAVQALAIDEKRKPFAPVVWTKPTEWGGLLAQAWFPGVHSNVGGGYRPDGLADEALHWVVEQAERLGLEFDKPYLMYFRPCFNSVLKDSMTFMYKIMGPRVRTPGKYAPNDEKVHQSAIDRKDYKPSSYNPPNLEAFLAMKPPVVNTSRLPRGVPC